MSQVIPSISILFSFFISDILISKSFSNACIDTYLLGKLLWPPFETDTLWC